MTVDPKRREYIKREVQKYLGPHFQYRFEGEYYEDEETAENVSFILKTRAHNPDAFIKERIAHLKTLNFGDVEDWKIGGIGRFINVAVRDLNYYLNEKRSLEEQLARVEERIAFFTDPFARMRDLVRVECQDTNNVQ